MACLRGVAAVAAALTVMTLSGCSRWIDAFVYQPGRSPGTTPGTVGMVYEEVRFPAADGVELHGWWIPGTRATDPVVVLFHGNAGNLSDRVDLLRRFHDRLGVALFAFDYRGYGLSSGRPSDRGLLDDARGVRALASARGWNERGLVLFGRSLGAAVALASAAEDTPAGLVLEAAFTTLEDMARLHYPLLSWPFRRLLAGRWNNMERIRQVRCPVLFLHGDRDRVVPIGMGWRLYDACTAPKAFRTLTGAGHDDPAFVGGEPYWEAWRRFLERLPAGPGLDKSEPGGRL